MVLFEAESAWVSSVFVSLGSVGGGSVDALEVVVDRRGERCRLSSRAVSNECLLMDDC